MNLAIKDVSINFPDEGLCTGCEVEFLGENKYLLKEHPLMAGSAKYGDIKAIMHEYILSKDLIASEPFKVFKEMLSNKGIFWQNDFGGVFICFTNPDSEIDIAYEISKFT